MFKIFKKLSLAVLVPLSLALFLTSMILGNLSQFVYAAEHKPAAIFVIGDNSVTNSQGYTEIAATATTPITYVYKEHVAGWQAAVDFSTLDKRFVKVELKSNWTAQYDADADNTSFGSNANAFSHGRIFVPATADILFDLKGLNVDRNLINRTGSVYGGVFYVEGNLEVTTDPELSNGKICGGNTINSADGLIKGNGGGVYVASGSFTLSGGEITNNKAQNFGGGIYCNTSLTINKGGVLQNESGSFGGAVYMGTGSKFALLDGEICENESYSRGAVCVYGEFNMSGGKINENTTTVVGHGIGGGVFVANGKFEMSGGEICANLVKGSGNVAGGGVSLTDNSVFNFTGGLVNSNKAVNEEEGTSKTAAGGVYVASGSQITVGGSASISYNEVVGAFNDVQGAGIYVEQVSSAKVVIEGNAEIAYNKAYVGTQTDKVVAGFGGAIAVNDGVLNIKGGKIHHNLSANASAIYVANGVDKTVISSGVITENLNAGNGGAIYWGQDSRPKVEGNAQIFGNYSLVANANQTTRYVDGYVYKNSDNTVIAYNANINGSVVAVDALRKVYCSNLQIRDNSNAFAFSVGKFTTGAKISIGVATKNHNLTVDYKSNNNISGVVIDPKEYLETDSGNSLYVNEGGEVIELPQKLELKIAYQSAAKTIVKGYSYEVTYDLGRMLATTLTYGSDEVALKVLKDGREVTNVKDAGKYVLSATVATGVEVQWNLVIKPKTVTMTNIQFKRMDEQAEKVYFNKGAHEYNFYLFDGETQLVEPTDYTKKFEEAENTYAGRGKIRVTYCGNYSGEFVYEYDILTATASYTSVKWEYADASYVESNTANTTWKPIEAFTLTYVHKILKFADKDFSVNVRAVLTTADGYTDYVYVADHSQNKTGMFLTFNGTFNGNKVDRLKNATTYLVEITGTPNYVLSDELKTTKVAIEQGQFEISESNFAEDSSTNRLWLLKIDQKTSQGLGDKTVYFDSNAALDSTYGARVTQGDKDNAYVRYTGENLVLELNPNYLISGKPLSHYLNSISDIDYTVSVDGAAVDHVTGEADTVTTVVTTVKLALNKNYVFTEGGKEFIELRKEWYVVTVNNTLRTTDESEQVKISDFTFGDKINYMPFRPEHGDVAVYTLTKGQEVVKQFAIKFSDTSSLTSVVNYYEAKTVNKVLDADLTKPINVFNYYVETLRNLSVGSYSLNVFVPRYQASGEHNHWWQGAKSTETTVYYPISCTYPFEVTRLRLTDANTGLQDKDITVKLADTKVYYSGAIDNIPQLEVTFDGKTLKSGVDYRVTSENVNVGVANFDIFGLGNFSGKVTIANAYEIKKAINGWSKLPAISIWAYGDYKPDLNLITAKPYLLDSASDLLFKITTDAEGKKVVDGLAEFSLNENGSIAADKADVLASLTVGKYYLFVWVKDSANYQGLEESSVSFDIFRGVNAWTDTKGITSWTEGLYNPEENAVVIAAKFGEVKAVIKDKDGNIVYDSVDKIDNLANLQRGVYTLTAVVEGTANYSGLVEYAISFEVFAPAGLPVWVTPTAVGAALLLVAIVLLILWKVGVFQLLTEKVVVAIRTKASIDATIAAVRAAKRMEEGRKSIAEADRREAEERRRAQEKPKAETPKEEEPKVEEVKVEEPKAETPKVDEPSKTEAPKAKVNKKKDN